MKTRSSTKKEAETRNNIEVSRSPQKTPAVRKPKGGLVTKSKKKTDKRKTEKKKLVAKSKKKTDKRKTEKKKLSQQAAKAKESFQNLTDVTLVYKDAFSIRTPDDQHDNIVTGFDITPDGRIIVADASNGNLKLLIKMDATNHRYQFP